MSAEQSRALWIPPTPFRIGIEDLEQISARLLDELDGQVVVPVEDIEFLARRLNRLARDVHRALPADVT